MKVLFLFRQPFRRRTLHCRDGKHCRRVSNEPAPTKESFKDNQNQDETSPASLSEASGHSDTSPAKKVRFATEIEIIPNPHADVDINDVWFSDEDCEAFLQHTMTHARVVHSMQRASFNPLGHWTNKLQRIYESFQIYAPSTMEVSEGESHSDRLDMDENHVGMETYCVPAIARDALVQRAALMQEITELQNDTSLNAHERIRKIQETSQRRTRPSVNLAAYIAKQNARLPSQNHG